MQKIIHSLTSVKENFQKHKSILNVLNLEYVEELKKQQFQIKSNNLKAEIQSKIGIFKNFCQSFFIHS